MAWNIIDLALFAVGYAASIYTWPTVKLWVNGSKAEIAKAEAAIAALKAKL